MQKITLFLLLLALGPAELSAEQPHSYARTIYLVRHGAYSADAKANPAMGPALNTLGLAQARLIAARLRGMPLHFDSLTSSTMTRARQTADVIHESLPEVPLTRSAQLVECAPPAMRAIEGETPQEQARCAAGLDQVFKERFTPSTDHERAEVIVAHGNVIRYLITKALQVDTHSWLMMSVAHASLSVIQVRADGSISVLAVGDTGHIPPNMLSFGTDSDPLLVAPRGGG